MGALGLRGRRPFGRPRGLLRGAQATQAFHDAGRDQFRLWGQLASAPILADQPVPVG